MKIKISVLQMGRLFKEIPNQPERAFEMICPDAREMVGKVSRW